MTETTNLAAAPERRAAILVQQQKDWPRDVEEGRRGNPFATLCMNCYGRHPPPHGTICPNEPLRKS